MPLAAGSVIAVIPARYASSRLPGKPLKEIDGVPMVVRAWRSVSRAGGIQRVIVATDDERIADVVRRAGGDAMITSDRHPSFRGGLEAGGPRAVDCADPLQAPVSTRG